MFGTRLSGRFEDVSDIVGVASAKGRRGSRPLRGSIDWHTYEKGQLISTGVILENGAKPQKYLEHCQSAT